MIGNLEYIINKSIVVDTYSPENFMENPDEIYANYEKYLSTYIQVGGSNFDERFVKKIKNKKTVKGYISAPYGYGKTSKALSLWNYCKENNILAAPPFKFDGKLDSIMDAVYGWTLYVFNHKYPEYSNSIEEIYLKYKAEGKERYIKNLQQKKQLTRNEAEEIINELSDNLIIGVTPKILMQFLREINNTIKEKFDGLAIFVDEVQGITSTDTINELRNFIFELGTYNEGIGILFILPDYQEEELATRAGDLIDRLKKDEFYLNLINIYTNSFAENLWKTYGEKFGFESYSIITKDCLRSIGEVSSKEHLGRGPRTVINAFKRACTIYKDTTKPYDVLDFVNDVLNNKVEYVQPKYIEELNRALSLNEINSEEKRNVIKLLGAFPNGISEDKIKAYGLWNAFEELQNKLYGTIIKYTIEGYSIEGLEHGDSNDFITQQIIQFRTHFAENDMYIGDMTDAFLKYILPEMFPKRRGNQILGWTYRDNTPITKGHFIFLEGTFDSKYPNRFMETYVVRKELNDKTRSIIEQLVDKIGDISYEFVLNTNNSANSNGGDDLKIDYDAGHIIFKFNMLKKVAEHELPGDLKILQKYVKPQDVNPMFILCLLKHLDNLEENSEIYTKFEGEIKSMKNLLVRYLKRFLFNGELRKKHNLMKNYEKMIEEIFTKVCESKFPHYHTLIYSVNYSKDLEKYRNYLRRLPISKRRGELIESTKRELLSELTGSKNPNVSGFNDECKTGKWKNLVKIVYWGRDDKVKFKLIMHPLEQDIWNTFKNKFDTYGSVKREEIEEYAFGKGYLIDEIGEIIKLLESRGYIKYDKDNDLLIKQKQLSNVDVLNKFEEIINKAKEVAKIYREYGETPNLSIDFKLKDEIKNEYNEDILHGYMDRVNDWERSINVEFRRITEKLNNDKLSMLDRINKTIAGLNKIKANIEEEGEASITCSSLASIIDHINRIPKNLKKECQNSIWGAKELKESVECPGSNVELAKRLKHAKNTLNDIKRDQGNINEKYKKWQIWKKLIGDMENIYRSIEEYQEHLDIEKENSMFEHLIDEIQHGFARERDEYLFKEEYVEPKINQIANHIKNKERLLRKGFNDKKEDVGAILNSIMKDSEILNNNPIRYNIAFSIEDRDLAYQNLNDLVKDDMKDFISSYKEYIAKINTKIDIKIDDKSEKDELYKKLHKIEKEPDKLRSILYDLDIIEELDDIRNMKNSLIKLGREIKEIDRYVKKISTEVECTEEEKRILEILNKEKEMSLGELIRKSDMNTDEVIKCLTKLDNHIEIIVRKK